jgi:hypothetical protein
MFVLQTFCVMAVSIFLVHGTFARNADWIQDNSPFCSYLRDKLCVDDITPINWTGRNTTKARHDGMIDLSTKLKNSLAEKPASLHVVIGHSHGGTIALQAVNSPEFVNRVRIVLLSTPILVPRKREFTFRLGFTMSLGAYLSAALSLTVLSAVLENSYVPLSHVPSKGVVITCMIVAGASLFFLYRYLARTTKAIVEQNVLAVMTDIRMLIVRESADEASSFLGAVQLGTRIVSMFFGGIEAVADKVENWTKKAAKQPLARATFVPNAILLASAMISLGFILSVLRDTFRITPSVATIASVMGILGLGLLFNRRLASGLASHGYFMVFSMMLTPFVALTFPIWLLLAVVLFPIREAILSALFVDVSAEATPEGTWNVTHLVPTPGVFAGWGLSHSAAHDDPRVFARVVDWIKEQT